MLKNICQPKTGHLKGSTISSFHWTVDTPSGFNRGCEPNSSTVGGYQSRAPEIAGFNERLWTGCILQCLIVRPEISQTFLPKYSQAHSQLAAQAGPTKRTKDAATKKSWSTWNFSSATETVVSSLRYLFICFPPFCRIPFTPMLGFLLT